MTRILFTGCLAPVVLAAFGCTSGPGQSDRPETRPGNRCTFRGQVTACGALAEFSGPVVVADVDPRFVIRLAGVRPVARTPPVASGGTIAYAIHSPARLLGASADRVVGRWYLFHATQAGRIVFLEASPIDAPR